MFCLQYFHPKYKIVQNCVQYCVIDGKMLILFHTLYKIVQFYFNVKYFEIVIILQFSQAFLRALSEATISENEQRRMQELCSRNGKDLFIVVFYPSTPVKWRCVHHYQLKCSPAKLFTITQKQQRYHLHRVCSQIQKSVQHLVPACYKGDKQMNCVKH